MNSLVFSIRNIMESDKKEENSSIIDDYDHSAYPEYIPEYIPERIFYF